MSCLDECTRYSKRETQRAAKLLALAVTSFYEIRRETVQAFQCDKRPIFLAMIQLLMCSPGCHALAQYYVGRVDLKTRMLGGATGELVMMVVVAMIGRK